jgi:hypothetical protein
LALADHGPLLNESSGGDSLTASVIRGPVPVICWVARLAESGSQLAKRPAAAPQRPREGAARAWEPGQGRAAAQSPAAWAALSRRGGARQKSHCECVRRCGVGVKWPGLESTGLKTSWGRLLADRFDASNWSGHPPASRHQIRTPASCAVVYRFDMRRFDKRCDLDGLIAVCGLAAQAVWSSLEPFRQGPQ